MTVIRMNDTLRNRPVRGVLRAGKPFRHEAKESDARHFVLAGDVSTHPACKFSHGLTSFGRWVGHANLCAARILAIRLQYALSETVAEIQPRETDSISGSGGAGISKIAGRPNIDTYRRRRGFHGSGRGGGMRR